MQELMIAWIDALGYWGVFALIALENLFPPIPSEVILTFGGFLTTRTALTPANTIWAATAGSLAGALALYMLGRMASPHRLKALLGGRLGEVLQTAPQDIDTACARFERQGAWCVLYCRCIPIVRSLISIPAGMTEMPLTTFFVLTAVGSTVWNAALIGAGVLAGEHWDTAAQLISQVADGVKLVLIVLTAAFVGYRVFQKAKKYRIIQRKPE